MTGSPVTHARLLVRLGNPVHVGAQRDHRRAAAVRPAGGPGARHARHAESDVESGLFQHPRQVTLGLELLHSQLAEREEHVHDLLDLLGAGLDHAEDFVLESFEILGVGGRRRQGEQGDRKDGGPGD